MRLLTISSAFSRSKLCFRLRLTEFARIIAKVGFAEFAKRYNLRAHDSQDDVALWELFSTTFVHRLATELQVYWEQRGADLVFWQKGHESEAADLDRFCLEAWHVLQRYLEEWQ